MKKEKGFPQNFKEDIYIAMLSKIVLSIEESIDIIFDTFNKEDFEIRIVDRVSTYDNVKSIASRDSQVEPGLQLIDNMCSILRMKKTGNDKYDFYLLIEDWVQEV